MWLFAMFDLPVVTKSQRKIATGFRNSLLRMGFSMVQYSVYARFCPSEDSASSIRADLRRELPAEGQIRVVAITDRQFALMEVYFGKKRKPAEEPPRQIMLF